MKKIRLVTVSFIVLAVLLFAGIAAAANTEVVFTWNIEGQEVSVQLEKQETGKYVLYLPGAFKGRDPVLSVSQNMDMVWDGTTYRSGETIPVSQYAGQTVQVSFSGFQSNWKVKVMQGSDIPALFIHIDNKDFLRVTGTKGPDIQQPAELVMFAEDGSLNAAEPLTSFKMRGNSTIFASKKAFSLKIQNKADLGGMGKNKKWILLANWNDISLLRNQITFELYRHLGMTYTPDCRQVDMFVNKRYDGIYLLTEKIQLKKNRLEISDLEEEYERVNGKEAYDNAKINYVRYKTLNIRWYDVEEPENITGGYLLEIELPMYYQREKENAGVKTKQNLYVTIKEPSHVGKRGAEYIADIISGLNDAAMAKDGRNSEGKYYADYLDLHSFALKVCVDELSASYDVRASSQFMYKEKDSVDPLLYAGPAWDYDFSYGNHRKGMNNPKRLDFVYRRSRENWFLARWFLTHEDFQQETRKVYEEEVYPALEILMGRKKAPEGSALKSLDEYKAAIEDSAAMNYTRWTSKGRGNVYPASGQTFEDSYAYLKNWIEIRSDLLFNEWKPGQTQD